MTPPPHTPAPGSADASTLAGAPPEVAATPPPRGLRARLFPILRVLGAALLLGFILARADRDELLGLLGRAPWWALVVPAALLIVNTTIQSVRLWLLFEPPLSPPLSTSPPIGPASLPMAPPATPRPPLRAVLHASFVAAFVGLALPAGGGDAVKVLALRPYVGLATTVGVLAESRVQDMLPWGLLLILALFGPLPQQVPELLPVAGLGALGFLGGWLGLMPIARTIARLEQLPRWIRTFFSPFAASPAPIRSRLTATALTVPFALINVLAVWAILRGFDVPMRPLDVALVVPTADVLISLPVTVGGLGVREHTYALVFAPWGCTLSQAIAVALTRWAAEWGRAGLGGLLLLLGRNSRAP